MTNSILVVYSTRYGATADIAEKIGQVLREAGLKADVMAVEQKPDVARYDAVVLGSAVYMGQWRKDAAEFLERNEVLLAQRPIWFFSSGPTGEGDASQLMKGWRFPEALQPIADRIEPRDIAFFHGALDMKKLNFGEKLIVKGVRAPIGDFRDWNSIAAWATSIAETLKKEVAAPQTPN